MCGSRSTEGQVCLRWGTHDVHWDPGYTVTWTDDEAVEVEVVTAPKYAHRHGSAVVGGVWLSRREVQVLQTAADGLTTVEAAEKLGLHPNTVKSHKQRLAKRLGASNTAHAVAMAFRAGALT